MKGNNQFNKPLEQDIKNSDKLDLLSGVITTLGYAVGVLSTLALIEEKQKTPTENVQIQQEHLRQLNQMQQQLDHMTRQIALIERRTR
ncbi:hypothetical protein ACIQ4I_11910 [Rummeliibacillus sp. NPDC094406]|uniref:hypothetical protein n=1 Tax=Rummeliibacillus sp. NPDC094406 TaxID=3364511 RepID=UPI00382F69A0